LRISLYRLRREADDWTDECLWEEVVVADCMNLTEFLEKVNSEPSFADDYRAAKKKSKEQKAFFKEHNVCKEARKALKGGVKAGKRQLGEEQFARFKVVIF
jgi:hypothetical protein